jgi:FKBP-type peptidyl-prolyl cis-trans isomerase
MKSLFLSLALLLLTTPMWSQENRQEFWGNGGLKYEGLWNGELRVGKHKWWHENGEKSCEVNFSATGKPEKIFTWNEQGEIIDEMDFKYEGNNASEFQSREWVSLPTGLKMYIEPSKMDLGPKPVAGQTVVVRYTLSLADGSVVQDNFNKGKGFKFKMGEGSVIPGFEEAILQLNMGQKGYFIISPESGYGNQLVGNIPPDSHLYYLIFLDGVSH